MGRGPGRFKYCTTGFGYFQHLAKIAKNGHEKVILLLRLLHVFILFLILFFIIYITIIYYFIVLLKMSQKRRKGAKNSIRSPNTIIKFCAHVLYSGLLYYLPNRALI